MKSFVDKVAAITGAGSGIGRALALALAKAGAQLALSDIDAESAEETALLARAWGKRVTVQQLDVAQREAVHAWADQVRAEHGRCNLIFNNAGVALAASLEGVSYDDFAWIMNINFWGVVHGSKAFLPHLRASGEGHVVNLSSVFGLLSVPGQGAYNASKFAVRGFSEALRQELELTRAPVSVTTVYPGGIRTNIAKSSRISDSVRDLVGSKDLEHVRRDFERFFTTGPEAAAETILRGVRRDQRRVLIGSDAVLIDKLVRLLPDAHQAITKAALRRGSA